jgi:cell division protein FtsB
MLSCVFAAAELMVIMSVAEKLKKQTAQVHALSAEKEDLNARLEVRLLLFCSVHHFLPFLWFC